MVKSREKRKHRWWIPVIITAAVLVAALGIYKTKNSRTDADLILTISGQGFEGHFYDAGERDKAVITFSGSEGGSGASDTMAWYYKQHGISSLGVTLFAGKETGKNLDRVPLEYVENAITWLKEQGFENIAVDGISKGSEYALLAASRFDDISCVAARVPSYFVSEGMIGRSGPSGTSCWSYRGEELNYTPYIVRDFDVFRQLRLNGEFNILTYNTGKDVTDESIIPMENIHGPVLLISTEADTVWPSAEQAAYIERYLSVHDFSYEVKNLTYKNVSHFAIPMRRNTWLLKLMFRSERQSPEKCADRLLLCTPGGQFSFSDMKDNARIAKLFETKPESEPLQSIVLGTVAMFLQFFGYLALGIWMRQYAALWANLMIVGAAMIYTFGLAHHILGCAAEWIYIKSDHTEEGWSLTNSFFGKTSATMIGCYAGILLFSVAHFIPVVTGMTPLPAWACVFNLLPLFLVQAPFNIPGAGNIAGAAMYLGLFILFLI